MLQEPQQEGGRVELVALQAPVQQAALVDPEVEVDERVVPAEVAQDLREPGEREVVRDADAQPPARPVTAEVGRRLLGRGDDIARDPGHRLAVEPQHAVLQDVGAQVHR